MAWEELRCPAVSYSERVELREDAGRALRRLRGACGRMMFLRLQLEALWWKVEEGVGVEVVRGLRGWEGIRIVGDSGTMRVLGRWDAVGEFELSCGVGVA